jgi:outer membrane biosynthesis protein TonB
MKHFKQRHFAIIPLLSILAMSPGMVESKYSTGRSVASVKEEVKPEEKKEESKHPKYDAAVAKVKPEDVKDVEIAKDKLESKKMDLFRKLERDLFTLEPTESLVAKQRKYIESAVTDILLLEGAVKKLADKKELTEEEAKKELANLDSEKERVDERLTLIESYEAEIAKAKAEQPKKEDKPVVAEEPKKEDKPVVAEKPKEEPQKEEPKKEEEKKEAKCEFEEQNKVLSNQVEELMKQNQQILQSMLGMSNMMVGMYSQMQQQRQQAPNPYYQNGPGYNSSPYQYVQPQTAGNWVYYPQGYQPQQTNIFAPQYSMPQQQQAPVQGGGFYPDQSHMQQQSGGWQLNADPRYTIQNQFTPGTFGDAGQSGLTFNMGQNSNSGLPMSQMGSYGQTPILGQAPAMTMPQGQPVFQGLQTQNFPRQF